MLARKEDRHSTTNLRRADFGSLYPAFKHFTHLLNPFGYSDPELDDLTLWQAESTSAPYPLFQETLLLTTTEELPAIDIKPPSEYEMKYISIEQEVGCEQRLIMPRDSVEPTYLYQDRPSDEALHAHRLRNTDELHPYG